MDANIKWRCSCGLIPFKLSVIIWEQEFAHSTFVWLKYLRRGEVYHMEELSLWRGKDNSWQPYASNSPSSPEAMTKQLKMHSYLLPGSSSTLNMRNHFEILVLDYPSYEQRKLIVKEHSQVDRATKLPKLTKPPPLKKIHRRKVNWSLRVGVKLICIGYFK